MLPTITAVAVPLVLQLTELIVNGTGPSVSIIGRHTVIVPSSGIVTVLSFTTGASFTGVTVMKMVSFVHNDGNGVPLSHTLMITVSTPL